MFKKSRLRNSIFVVIILCLQALAQTSDTFPDLIEKIKPSVVSITTYDQRGKGLSRGTGFCVSSNHIVTNYHVIEGAVRIEIKTADSSIYKVIRVESGDKSSDLALLQTEELDSDVKPLRLSSVAPRVGEKILVVGNPLGLSGSVSDGIVAAFRNVASIGKLIQITAPISHGSSGSPVVNVNGEVIGVATLNLEGGQNLNFAISSETLVNRWPNLVAVVNNKSIKTTHTPERWRPLLSMEITYDTETATNDAGIISAWIRYRESDGRYEKVLTEINCNNSQIRRVRSLSYEKGGDISRQSDTPSSWSTFVPDSRGESMFKIFCKDQPDYQNIEDWNHKHDLIEQGSKLMDSKKYEEAIAIYLRLIEEFPRVAGYGFLQIGVAKQSQGKLQEARLSFLEAVKIEPDDYYYVLLAKNYEKEKNIPAAIAAYWKSLRLDKTLYHGRWELVEIYRQSNNYKALSGLYTYLVAEGEIDSYDELANAYEKQGLKTLARSTRIKGTQLLEKQVRLDKAEVISYLSLANLYKSLKDTVKLRSILISGVEKFPKDTNLTVSLAENYNDAKEWSHAVQVIKDGLPYAKDNFYKKLLLTVLKNSYVGLNQLKEAAEVEQQLSELK